MAVPKTTDTRCSDRAYKHCNNPIPTSFFSCTMSFQVILEHNQRMMSLTKKEGYLCSVCMPCLYTYNVVSVVFGTAIPTSLNIFGKCFMYLFVSFFCCTIAHHIGGCSSSSLPSGTNKQTCDHRQLLLCIMGWDYIARS